MVGRVLGLGFVGCWFMVGLLAVKGVGWLVDIIVGVGFGLIGCNWLLVVLL